MSKASRTFEFNTAITAVPEDDGKFDESAHREQVLPLRGRLMQHDGMTGCRIDRYEVEVNFLDNVTTLDQVKRVVEDAVAWASTQPGLFPLRGDKSPAAVYRLTDVDRRQDTTRPRWLTIKFSSFLVALKPLGHEGVNEEDFDRAVRPLAEQMLALDGVVNFKLLQDSASVKYDPEFISSDDVKTHLVKIFSAAVQSQEFFPFLDEGEDISFSFRDS